MAKILVSACLLGRPVRYDGSARTMIDERIRRWQADGRLVVVCPELISGLDVRRPAAEIAERRSGDDVLSGGARVITSTGVDLTDHFIRGAQAALSLAQVEGCEFALLTDGSPSCGSGFVHDGSFQSSRVHGEGVTASLLRANGIAVFAETEIDALARAILDR